MALRVLTLSAENTAALNALAVDRGSVFYSAEWRGVFGSDLQLYGVFDDHGGLAGAFQLVEERRAGIRVLRNPPFTPVCGPLFRVTAKHPVAVREARRDVLTAVADFLACQRRAVVSLSLDHAVQDVMAFCWRGFKATPRYTYQVDLRRSGEEILKGFTSTRRNDVSKARRDGLRVERATDLRVVECLVRGTFTRQKARLDAPVLERILFQFARPENSFAFVVWRGERPIACSFVIHDRQTAYYLLGGYDAVERHHGAGALAVTDAIQEAQRRGLVTFDFEGSMIPAIERFFRGFGGELVHFFTVSRAWLPFEFALKPFKRSQF